MSYFGLLNSQVRRAISAGVPAENISLSTQELPEDFADLIDMGVKINAWYVIHQ